MNTIDLLIEEQRLYKYNLKECREARDDLKKNQERKKIQEEKLTNTRLCSCCHNRRNLECFDNYKTCNVCRVDKEAKKEMKLKKLAETKVCTNCNKRHKLDCFDDHKTCSICRTPKEKEIKIGIKCSACDVHKPEDAFKQKKNGISKCCLICLDKRKVTSRSF